MSKTKVHPPSSSNGWPEAEPPSDGVFDPRHERPVDADTLESALVALLKLYPDAPIASFSANGVSVPMPDSVPLVRNPVVEARSGLDMVIESDHMALIANWDRVLRVGAGRCIAHLISDPERSVSLHGFDVRKHHGVLVTVFAPADKADSPVRAAREVEIAEAAPRFATIHKNQSAFIIKIDERLTKILGWSAEEMEGHRSIDFVHPDDHALALDNWMEMLSCPGPGRRIRQRLRRRDDSWVWFEVTNHNLIDDPDYRCVVCEMVDISDEMAAQETLRAREQLLDRLAEAAPVGLIQIDPAHKIVYTNERLHEIVGVPPASTLEAQLASVVPADEAVVGQALEDVLERGAHANIEVGLHLLPSRESRFCTINVRPLSREDGTISGAIACVADVTDSARLREELKKRATFDELTGCYNRPAIVDALEGDIARGKGHGERAVMFVDLDGFKQVNDQHGHAAGDQLLRIVAERLRKGVRDTDMVGRIGGDEFLVVCPEVGGAEPAMALAERLAETVREDTSLTRRGVEFAVSIGVAWSKGAGEDADALVARADGAMYESKGARAGRPTLATAAPEPALIKQAPSS